MRSTLLLLLLGVVACGEDAVVTPEVDGVTGNRPDPRVIAGGGIGDGAIDGVVNLYVIDDTSRDPISGAEVRVGTVTGLTGADGLFVAEGVTGPQDIVVKAAGQRNELWLGANGANVTINLEKDLEPAPASVSISGTITNYASLTVAAGHAKVAFVSYSSTDQLGDPENEIVTPVVSGPFGQNVCIGEPCNFTINTRTGKLALFATIFDFFNNNTPADDTDDTVTLIGFAVRTGIDTGALAGNQNLTLIDLATGAQDVTVDFDSPPSSLDTRGALIGIEIGDEGVLNVSSSAGTGAIKVPKLSAISGATGYRLTAIAADAPEEPDAQSIALRRGLTGTTLAADSWLEPPTGLSLTKQGGSWTAITGATVTGIELTQGDTKILNVTVFDGRSEFEMPDLITLPSGPITAAVNAIGAAGFDVTNFALDDDADKIDRVSAQTTTIN